MSLEDLRKKIDDIDSKLVELLNERARVVVKVGKYKDKNGGPIYAPHREKAVLEKISRANTGPLPDKTLTAIWREMMSGSFFLERPLRIAFLGPEGSFSHSAAMLKFGQSVDYEAVADIRTIFNEVSKGHSDLGIVPIENSAGGGIDESLDAFVDSDVYICAEVYMAIHHNLLANCKLEDVKEVYSKPEVFAQCRKWLSDTFTGAKTIAVASSARAAQMAAEKPYTAAIGSTAAADLYGLKIVCENIEDVPNNVTRFLIIGKQDTPPTGDDKTSLLFSTAHKAGALVDVLEVFRDHGLNLANIESRPSKKREWEYYFFVDFVGHKSSEQAQKALEAAKKHCLQLSVLGSYPKNDKLL
ncbi:P-protein [Anaerohalosphaera lusitana]|uniref:Bifunctional chorismate mutase/prephenate dehydratase n=1 Tax=Anaerohalosphaera lusitana TaxID=1936003 RepID=A0A1U9NHJ1_9BACT|nr:prephenate dehydratase [Anaerohalosphaera lusitana]AQT67214.1 P-protein [Anaerohalosphaera lusitana]